jgi:hypothetical protein
LRTLTLGVLIVSAGTLAALPFRRFQAIPDASVAPTHVTGPNRSVLDLPSTDPSTSATGDVPPTSLAAADSAGEPLANLPATSLWPASDGPVSRRSIPPQAAPQFAAAMASAASAPLTYEDLAMPIDLPDLMRQRYSATAPARRHQLERERVAALVMPDLETLALSQQEELERVARAAAKTLSADDRSGGPAATATLASTATRESQPESLPSTPPVERVRHWIRQPGSN